MVESISNPQLPADQRLASNRRLFLGTYISAPRIRLIKMNRPLRHPLGLRADEVQENVRSLA